MSSIQSVVSATRKFWCVILQSDMEKLEGLPVAPFMDRDKVTKSSSQIGFIKFALLPLFEALRELFPVIEVCESREL